jgi:hypothetical protein
VIGREESLDDRGAAAAGGAVELLDEVGAADDSERLALGERALYGMFGR